MINFSIKLSYKNLSRYYRRGPLACISEEMPGESLASVREEYLVCG